MSVLNQSGEDAVECPLCMEPLEVDDLNFYPCTCGYQICRFCWHRIRTDENGLCPACRKAYPENPADFKPLTKEEIARLKAEKRLKDQQRKQRVTENRKHLANVRVVQKNLVFVVGLPMRLADADVLKRHEYFGKFGKIHKVVINQSTSYAGSQGPSASAYVTYQRQEDALRAIEAVNNILVDGRTVKTSLGTTKYCSHFMRNQACPKPDCMYLHDFGDQEASFTKEEMHLGKHQEYERKLVQSLHAHASALQRKPTPSPPVTGSTVRENGTANPQTKEAWPSLQPGQTNSTQTNSKEPSPAINTLVQQSNGTNGSASLQNHTAATINQQNNNNKGEGGLSRRGKSNSESKAQAARNKHKNSQNKEKHGVRTTSRSESNSTNGQTSLQMSSSLQTESRNSSIDSVDENTQKPNTRSQMDQHNTQVKDQNPSEFQNDEAKINGVLENGEMSQSESDSDPPREGSTPASIVSSTEESTHHNTGLVDSEEMGNVAVLGTSPASTTSSQGLSQQLPPGLHVHNGASQIQLNHRSIFQTDNNSFFSSNTFQKVSSTVSTPPTSQTGSTSLDWMSTGLVSIPDSLPTVHSSEDWQAAFGFQPEASQANSATHKPSPSTSPSISFNPEEYMDGEIYANSRCAALAENATSFASSFLTDSPASKFMADFQQNSLRQRLVMQAQQNQENCDYIKQNGQATLDELHKHHSEVSTEIKADDDLGFDPFHETQKALAELMENEMQLQQQRLFQQQQQQQRDREKQSRVQQQGLTGLGPQHFPQVAHIAHLHQQAQHIQNLQALQSHSLLSRLPSNLIPPSGSQSPVPTTATPTNLGQRSRLPPPGFPGSAPNHMNSFGLGIPRPASTNNALSGSKILPFMSHSSGVLYNGAQPPPQNTFLPNGAPLLRSQGVGKCAGDAVYSLKDWCEIGSSQQQYHQQALHQKGGWNNIGPIADWTSIDPAIVSSSRPVPFQATATWQFPHVHSPHAASHATQQEPNPPQHWAMQPPPGFTAPSSSTQHNNQQPSSATQSHSKLISAGSEVENL
ncbi:TPR-containing protein DDB_G0280363 isoform X2 [Athalia rosae]|uniref:TPR-containing protein DDB_G0280363 isoform X2 n=1 Tax=Athalia rosae TaxID=37344 RepID=UPI00203489F0|nr:TPR-containing protein DDB_G0280363 isoform X2 [Athalia rosae]